MNNSDLKKYRWVQMGKINVLLGSYLIYRKQVGSLLYISRKGKPLGFKKGNQ